MKREKFEVEFIFKSSPAILYQFVTTPSCLIRWFCDEADITGTAYAFAWDGVYEDATLIEDDPDERLRFQWDESEFEDEYFEYHFSKSPITNETIVIVTDFADKDEVEDQKELWKEQINQLKVEIGG